MKTCIDGWTSFFQGKIQTKPILGLIKTNMERIFYGIPHLLLEKEECRKTCFLTSGPMQGQRNRACCLSPIQFGQFLQPGLVYPLNHLKGPIHLCFDFAPEPFESTHSKECGLTRTHEPFFNSGTGRHNLLYWTACLSCATAIALLVLSLCIASVSRNVTASGDNK